MGKLAQNFDISNKISIIDADIQRASAKFKEASSNIIVLPKNNYMPALEEVAKNLGSQFFVEERKDAQGNEFLIVSKTKISDLTLTTQQAINTALNLPKERWPQDKLPKEKCEAFLRRVWVKTLNDDSKSKNLIRSTDYSLYKSINSQFSKTGIPADLNKWWAVRGTKTQYINELRDIDVSTFFR